MDLAEARRRIRERADLNAFISISEETGSGTVVAVKDLVDVAGMVTTAGGIILPNVPAADDAPSSRASAPRAAWSSQGQPARVCLWSDTSVNPHYGPVRNPHDPSRVAGARRAGRRWRWRRACATGRSEATRAARSASRVSLWRGRVQAVLGSLDTAGSSLEPLAGHAWADRA